MYLCVVVVTCTGIIVSKISSKPNEDTPEEKEEWPIPVDISLILGYLITVIFDYQIPHKPLKILSL